ncbi:MAG: serine hydrolase [Xanthobacteraceae bacterium]
MLRWRTEAPYGLRWGLLGLAAIVGVVAIGTDPADARSRRKRTATSSYSPAYAAIVLDANSGRVLHSSHPDALRHPASLTKIMTLYLLFERLEAGRITLGSPLRVSEHASEQSPTKLGLKEGTTIKVEDAIKGMITRSANDAAVVVAENLGGSESAFARMMTSKARALGMGRTVYRNASGLPDDAQVTTARDQAILGRAIQEHFPRYYKYFSIRSFKYRGKTIANHNRLLGKVEGVDGIKTGFTRASGFNLVTSVHRDGRYIIAVVLGGKSGAARDARMRQLVSGHIREAATRRTTPMIARAGAKPERSTSGGYALASASSVAVPAARSRTAPSAGSADPIRPVPVRTLSVRPGKTTKTASAAPLHLPSAVAPPETAAPDTIKAAQPKAQAPASVVARAGILGVLPRTATAYTSEPAPATSSVASVMAATPAAAARVEQPKAKTRSGWIIQVGAFPDVNEARQRLTAVKGKASRLLASADPFTEPVKKGATTLYRARFAGFDRKQAEAACKFLKRNDVDCLAIKN